MGRAGQLWHQCLAYLAFLLPVVYLTSGPSLQVGDPGQAQIKLTVRHAGVPVGDCVALRGAGSERLPSTVRPETLCSRERSPLLVRLRLDGELLFQREAQPSGWRGDGLASVYESFVIPAGSHRLEVFMNDDAATPDSGWTLSRAMEFKERQVVVVSFKDGFRIQ